MSVADELRKLADLKSEGFLSEAEFQAQKAVLLGVDVEADTNTKGYETDHQAAISEDEGLGVVGKVITWVLVVAGGIFILSSIFAQTPEQKDGQVAREAIKLCWGEQEKKSLTPGSQRFIAGACEMMERDYEAKYRRKP